jgi:UPF0176 protein
VFQDSKAGAQVFKRWSVQMRSEIVNLQLPDAKPAQDTHLTPEEWHAMLQEDVMVLDTRNTYETNVGTFKNAVDPKLKNFQEFPEYVRSAGIPKQKKVLMYCTGGIRCEKAIHAMRAQGYEHVYQLEGGILAYLKQFPNAAFEGECFVFDHRVAVDQELKPSARYALCPHCGDPGDKTVACVHCTKSCVICTTCAAHEERQTCSKNCRHHHLLRATCSC